MPTLNSSQQNILLAKPQYGFIELDHHGNVLNASGGYLLNGNFTNLKTGDHCSIVFPAKAVHAIENAINGKEFNIELDLNNDLVELAISPQGQGQGVAIMLTKLNSPYVPSESLSDAQRFETLFNAAHDAIFTMNDREFIDCNLATLNDVLS